MNKKDKKEVEALLNELQNMKTRMEEIGATLGEMGEAEREKFDNMPESLQTGERGERMDAQATALDDASTACENGDIDSAISSLEDCVNA